MNRKILTLLVFLAFSKTSIATSKDCLWQNAQYISSNFPEISISVSNENLIKSRYYKYINIFYNNSIKSTLLLDQGSSQRFFAYLYNEKSSYSEFIFSDKLNNISTSWPEKDKKAPNSIIITDLPDILSVETLIHPDIQKFYLNCLRK